MVEGRGGEGRTLRAEANGGGKAKGRKIGLVGIRCGTALERVTFCLLVFCAVLWYWDGKVRDWDLGGVRRLGSSRG